MTLPAGWEMRSLGDVASTALGKMLDRGNRRGLPEVPYLRNVNVQWDRIDASDVLSMELAEDERDRFGVEPGDLLVCEGGEIGRAAIWRGAGDFIAYQKALHRVRPSDGILSRYLLHLFRHLATSGRLAAHATGTTIAHLPQRQLRRLVIPVPPIDEQRRIVDILEDHLSRLDAANEYLCRATVRLLGLIDSALAADSSLGDAARVPLADLLDEPLRHGRSVPTAEDGFPVLRLTAIRDGRIELSARKSGAWTEADASRFLVRRGDFLVARGNGSLQLVGRGGLVTCDPDPVAYPDTAIRVRTRPDEIDSRFLALIWNAREVRAQIENRARTTAGIYKINQADMRSIVIPAPGLTDQAELLARFTALIAGRDRLTIDLNAAQTRAGSLRRALLRAAFSGQLTGHPSDLNRAAETVG